RKASKWTSSSSTRTPLKSNRTAIVIALGRCTSCAVIGSPRHCHCTSRPQMFNVSPFASLAEVNRMLAAWDVEAIGYEPARGGVENTCLIVDTSVRRLPRVVLRIHRPDAGARVALELAALQHLGGYGLPVPRPL